MFAKGAVVQTAAGELKPTHRPYLLNYSESEILSYYIAEIRGVCHYYRLAVNLSIRWTISVVCWSIVA
ncbi:MAG: hypothetical protein LBJ12_03325 [Oscillospiraceae bacterium]|jgi:hypothetical protein|nr:hypothetical protein [Oscillospiraceae bacterium]